MTTRARKQARARATVTRLRKTVSRVNTIYGLMVQALDALRGRVLDLESARDDDTRTVERELDEQAAELYAVGGAQC